MQVILWWAFLAVAGVALAVWLSGGALAAWREQQAGLVYELTPRYLGTVLRGAAAVAAFGCALTGSVSFALAVTPLDVPSAAAPLSASVDARATARPHAPAVPRARHSTAPAAALPVGMVTIGHPHGGELLDGMLPGLPGRVRVWLPAQYRGHTAPLQTLLVLADDSETDDVFAGLAAAVDAGRANPFVAVLPTAACAPTGTLTPPQTPADLARAVAARFHVVPDASGWAALGLGAGAPCAVAADLAHPDAYRAAAALGGRYDAMPVPAAGGPAPARLLLALARDDAAGQVSASHLNAALVHRPRTEIRVNNAVRDYTAQLERFRLVRLAAGYLTEQFAVPRP